MIRETLLNTMWGWRLAAVVLAGLLLPWASGVHAYDRWSIDDDATNCGFCHGDFRDNNYISKTDGQNWGDLHDIHREDMLNDQCSACHSANFFPVLLDESAGVPGVPAISCVGCHGRAEDADPAGTGTQGYGLATQLRHELANVGPGHNGLTCKQCHPRANPTGGATPVGEDVLPTYYGTTVIPSVPDDPCNPAGSENFAGAPEGIDNDGDLVPDQGDSDCTTMAATPGEVSGAALPPLLVTAHDSTSSVMTVSFGVACATTDNGLVYGPLAQLSSYAYSGQQCSIGASGSYVWNYPSAPDSVFFIVVGHDGSDEGSYGKDSMGTERPPNPACLRTQTFANRCD